MGQPAFKMPGYTIDPRYTVKVEPPKLGVVSFIRSHMPKKPRPIKDRQAAKEVGCVRLRELLWDLGRADDFAYGWKSRACAAVGIPYTTGLEIINGKKVVLYPDHVDMVSMTTGVPVSMFYDAEVR